MTFKQLVIPGTNDSGAFSISPWSLYYPQSESILGQLISGARALDLKIGLVEETQEFYTYYENNNQFYKMASLNEVINDVLLFVIATRQPLIFSINHLIDIHTPKVNNIN